MGHERKLASPAPVSPQVGTVAEHDSGPARRTFQVAKLSRETKISHT